MSHKKKRVCLSVDVKKKILKEVDAHVLTKTEIAKKFGIPKNSLSTIIKAREKIVTVHDGIGGAAPSRKYFREAKYPELEKELVAWLRKMRGKNIPIDGNLLKEQADIFASMLELKDFKRSDGWLQKFKLRHGLTFRKVYGESVTVDTITTNKWKEERLNALLSKYSSEDVFNVDESKLVQSKTEISKKFEIPKNSLSAIIKAQEKIVTVYDGGGRAAPSEKYFQEVKYPELEKELVAWLRKMRGTNIPIDSKLLEEQADIFASMLELKDFKSSDGWLQKFKLQHGLTFQKVCGESSITMNKWKEERLNTLLSKYSSDVFNVDESKLILTKTEIAKKFEIPKNSLSAIIKAQEKIVTVHDDSSRATPSQKYFHEVNYRELEKVLVAWLRKMRSKNIPIDSNLLEEQADIFASMLELKDFNRSDGWLQKFKLRHGLTFWKVCGESATVDTIAMNRWKEERLNVLLSKYSSEDVFNVDESKLVLTKRETGKKFRIPKNSLSTIIKAQEKTFMA